MSEPLIHVGILSASQIAFVLHGRFRASDGTEVDGGQTAVWHADRILWNNRLYDELWFEPIDNNGEVCFELLEVTIGINFHWERKENQRFPGALIIIVENNQLTAVNAVDAETYLVSVISSEMNATASSELLKAHAVISRSWLLSNLNAHARFNVCADDHCQRYQGITRASTSVVGQAVAATRGEVLTSGGILCDTRYSKCCGGALEEFRYAWEEKDYPYLKKRRDSVTDTRLPDLQQEAEAERWIRSEPEAFCNTRNREVLAQVLNDYDQETTRFYRWQVTYTQDELAELIYRRSGVDYGHIVNLVPVARGTSGRIWQLRIVGTKETRVIGKELEIRRTLSESHLYSSAFVVDREAIGTDDIPARFVLTGAGWGHGVGLCQIGAAMMGEQGYTYQEILNHYYTGATLTKQYE
ncbi:MAG: SpoIID/LytB domain-containing protein [Mediterranea sp.]|jgi:SpoIID/LytB domain protein|nr:SpoIID/LytB domain-containing protein [Mediterranea sp.]